MTIFYEYQGMSYEQASRAAERLVQQRGWFQSFERLSELRRIMASHQPENGERS